MCSKYRDRGRLILVTPVSVTVALLPDSAIYTENDATRTNQQEPRDSTSLQRTALTRAWAGIDLTHYDPGSHPSYTTLDEMEAQLIQ